MSNAPVTANVCTECDGTGQAALESSPRGHQMGDCPKCTADCRKCRTRHFIAALIEGFCTDCILETMRSMVEVTAVNGVSAEDAADQLASEYRYSRNLFSGVPGVC